MISHYKIIEKLGEGGMGVVYKAHDTKLDRDVALKFLPRDISQSDEERNRFIHEAKAASALDHPNICTIYEVDETPDGQMFIAMGYYEGISISKKIEKGHLDVTEAMWIAIQIAEGLQAAHEKGIVHRDIKSSNIIVSDKGQVRILDFGLARKKGLSKITKTGTTVGTASYMSPEQAQGDTIDRRTDLWSLGVVLYEMVTGKLPFRGEHEAAILYSVVNEQSQPIEKDVSPELMHILRWALEKDPAERYQSAGDLLTDLRRLKKDTSRTGFPPVSGEKKKLSSRRNKIIVTACALVILCVVGYLYLFKKDVEINPNFTSRWLQIPFQHISFPGLSPDGKWAVFGAEDKNKKCDLYAVTSTGGEVRQLTHDSSADAGTPNISPDGNYIVYWRYPGNEICVVQFLGGTSKKIGIGMTPKWSPDGKRIGYILNPKFSASAQSKSGNGEFWTMNPDGSKPRLEFTDSVVSKDYYTILSFAWSPDGQSVTWVRKLQSRHCEIVVHDLQNHKERPVISDTTHKNEIYWTSNNQLIYSSVTGDEMNLWMISATGGIPIQITKGMGVADGPSISRDGKILTFWQNKTIGHLWLASLDGSGKREEVISGEYWFEYPDISPNGKYIAVGTYITGTLTRHLFVMNRDGTNLRQITSGEISCWKPRWSPDGKMISYYARGKYEPLDSFKVYVINPHIMDVPRYVFYGTNQTWADSVTLEMSYGIKTWQAYLDGRAAKPFSEDSTNARTINNGRYVQFSINTWRAFLARDPTSVCRVEDWDGIGPKSAVRLSVRGTHINYDALYHQRGLDIFRISFHDWKTEKLNVNIQGIDTTNFGLRTTADGKEMVYKTTDYTQKLGVIENLFK